MTTPVGLTAESEALRDASLGMRLREYRKKEGLTLREAAKRAGISHSHLSKVETGRDWATDRTVRLLAAVYDAEPDMLLMDRNIDRVPYIVRRAIEAAAVARHVRETGCEGLREALDQLAWCAVRYGLGRRTYVTAHIAESVARVKDSLREDTRRIIVTDIDRAEERGPDGLGDSVDAGVWRGLRAALASPATEEACAREGCGHAATAHDEGDWTCDVCGCEEYALTEARAAIEGGRP